MTQHKWHQEQNGARNKPIQIGAQQHGFLAFTYGNTVWQPAKSIGKAKEHAAPEGEVKGCRAGFFHQKGEQERLYKVTCDTITNSIETLGGMVCDGAKASCAAKIGLAVENALMALELSLEGNVFQPGEGMTMEDPEDTIAAVGRMGRVGMKGTDVEILNIMLGN